jgi:hypothetical protein
VLCGRNLAISSEPSARTGRLPSHPNPLFSRPLNFAVCRRALKCKSATASLGALEQLGNLTVRFAQKVWQAVKDGEESGIMAEIYHAGSATALLGTSAPRDIVRIIDSGHDVLVEAAARGQPPPPVLTLHTLSQRSKMTGSPDAPSTALLRGKVIDVGLPSFASVESVDEDELATAAEEPIWRRIAAFLIKDGVELLERLCSFGETVERRSLLGSAYKRRAWTGLGVSRKDDLKAAAKAYSTAHTLEVAELTDDDGPNPYARLNQITLEMLATGDNDAQRERLLKLTRSCTPVV